MKRVKSSVVKWWLLDNIWVGFQSIRQISRRYTIQCSLFRSTQAAVWFRIRQNKENGTWARKNGNLEFLTLNISVNRHLFYPNVARTDTVVKYKAPTDFRHYVRTDKGLLKFEEPHWFKAWSSHAHEIYSFCRENEPGRIVFIHGLMSGIVLVRKGC